MRRAFPLARTVLLLVWLSAAAAAIGAEKGPAAGLDRQIAAGRSFLTNLFDPALDLLPEYQGARVYWLYHDNYLAAKVLESPRPDLARRIHAAIARHGVTRSGKIEILFGDPRGRLPFRNFILTNVVEVSGRTIRTEITGNQPLTGWEAYADLLLLASIAQAQSAPAEARRHFDAALALWDGPGFNDPATRHSGRYAAYKLALALIAAQRLGTPLPMRAAALERLGQLQSPAGGWITDYTASAEPRGVANVETTCMVLLALEREKRAAGPP